MKKILLLLLSLVLITGCGCNKEEKKVEQNNEEKNVVSDIKVNKLDMIDFITTYEDGITSVYYTVENNTDEVISYNYVICNMYDKDDNLIYTLKSDLGTLNPGESKDITANVTLDLSKVDHTKYNVE